MTPETQFFLAITTLCLVAAILMSLALGYLLLADKIAIASWQIEVRINTLQRISDAHYQRGTNDLAELYKVMEEVRQKVTLLEQRNGDVVTDTENRALYKSWTEGSENEVKEVAGGEVETE